MSVPKPWSNDHAELGLGGKRSFRPTILGTNGMVSSGHYLSTLAGVQLLQQGGNAIDAGVAAAVAGCVVQSEMVSFGGMASIQVYRADLDQSFTIAGVGHWPALASLEYFRDQCDGHVPKDVRNGVVPGAPDAYLTALERFGTWSFGSVSQRAVELAVDGFPMYPFRHDRERDYASMIERFPRTREVIWPDGRQVGVGEIMRQTDLGKTLQTLAAAERTVTGAASGQRASGLQAAREAFYQGEIADRIDRFYQEEGGFLRKSDLRDYRVAVDPPVVGTWRGYEIRSCPFWSKGPMLIQVLNMLEEDDLAALGHNSPAYVHLVTEALKLAFADRHAYYGDPLLVDVPADGLLSKAYAKARRGLIDPVRAWPEMPPAGDPWSGAATRQPAAVLSGSIGAGRSSEIDTSHLSVMDRWGNVFSATFSDSFIYGPLTPGTGLTVSTRGVQSWVDPSHPNRVRPGQRMVVTGSPTMAFKDGKPILALGSPGTDVQIQATTQVLLNILAFGMEAQEAIEAPRFATYSHPESFEPHTYQPGVLRVEARVPSETMAQLEAWGHTVHPWLAWQWQAGGVGAVTKSSETGVMGGGAETRRESYALGW